MKRRAARAAVTALEALYMGLPFNRARRIMAGMAGMLRPTAKRRRA